jgi:filamentous hemagglutinin
MKQPQTKPTQRMLTTGGNLALDANPDLVLAGVNFSAGGDFTGSAGRDLLLQTVQTGETLGSSTAARSRGFGSFGRLISIARRGKAETSTRTTEVGTTISAGGAINLQGGRDVGVTAGNLNAGSDIGIGTGRDLTITSAANTSASAFRVKRHKGNESRITQVQSRLSSGGSVGLSAGNDLTVRASTVEAAGNLSLAASGDTSIESAQDEFHLYDKFTKKRSFGRRTTTTTEETQISNVSTVLSSGGDITVNAQLTDNGVGLQDSGSVSIVGSDVLGDGQVVINAGDGLTLDAGEERFEYFKQVKKKGFAGLSGSNRTNLSEQQTTLGTEIAGGDNVFLISGDDTNVLASSIASDANINVNAGRCLMRLRSISMSWRCCCHVV